MHILFDSHVINSLIIKYVECNPFNVMPAVETHLMFIKQFIYILEDS